MFPEWTHTQISNQRKIDTQDLIQIYTFSSSEHTIEKSEWATPEPSPQGNLDARASNTARGPRVHGAPSLREAGFVPPATQSTVGWEGNGKS